MNYEKSMTYLIGQVMKLTKGRSDPKLVRKIFEEFIESNKEVED